MRKSYLFILMVTVVISGIVFGMEAASRKPAPKPLFRDPVYDGAADPVLCWNKAEKKWFMFYTNRRAKLAKARGVDWVHGTHIGIAESSDGGITAPPSSSTVDTIVES